MLHTRIFNLQGLAGATEAAGVLLADPTDKTVVISLKNLPELPPAPFYRVWAIVGDRKMLCGEALPQQPSLFTEIAIPPERF